MAILFCFIVISMEWLLSPISCVGESGTKAVAFCSRMVSVESMAAGKNVHIHSWRDLSCRLIRCCAASVPIGVSRREAPNFHYGSPNFHSVPRTLADMRGGEREYQWHELPTLRD